MNIVRNNRGVVLVFVAMGLLLFLLFLGLALDTGWLVYVRAQGQARIDSAALAAAAALIESGDRQSRAEELANTFSEKNLVVNDTVNPENVVTPMKYDETTGELETVGWGSCRAIGPNCNAVRVTTTVPTPVFFAGIRNVFGARETGQEDLTFSSVSHLPCPGFKLTAERMAPFALQNCPWIAAGSFRNSCGQSRVVFDLSVGQGTDILARTKAPSLLAPIEISSPIDLFPLGDADFQPLSYACETGGAAIVPVVDQCAVVGEATRGNVIGFATLCFSRDTSEDAGGLASDKITGQLKCGEVAPSSAGTGTCFGTYASNPILIR